MTILKFILNAELNLYEKNEIAYCDSLQIAETFERRHTHVIETIENLTQPTSGLSKEFISLNFEVSNYKDASGKRNKKYLLTKDDFVMVVMEFKTAKARVFKEAYIKRFNAMEEFIKNLKAAKMEYPVLTDAIQQTHDEPKFYHFSNEINMINRIVLGMDAKHFKEENSIDRKENSIRPYLTAEQIKAIEELQRIDIGLLIASINFEQRKELLQSHYYKKRLKYLQNNQ